jgi:hypothetical protein
MNAKYKVRLRDEPRRDFGSYGYIISCEERDVAEFRHNYRGECESLRVLATGHIEDPPFGMSAAFLAGGGDQPLGLTAKATRHLELLLRQEGTT